VKADTSCDPGCLLSTGTLPRIRWPLQPRSRDRHTAFWTMGRPPMTLSRHLGLRPVLSRSRGRWPEPRRSFRSPYPPLVSPIDVHFELGPRSLDPAAVFAARMPSLFETRRRLTTSATAYRRAGNQTIDSRFLAGTVASTTFLFLRTTPLIAEQWHAASRAASTSKGPGAGSSRLPEFAQPRCLQERPTTLVLPSVHSED
jgi:hypothetical protein